jgi:hypothetical protein
MVVTVDEANDFSRVRGEIYARHLVVAQAESHPRTAEGRFDLLSSAWRAEHVAWASTSAPDSPYDRDAPVGPAPQQWLDRVLRIAGIKGSDSLHCQRARPEWLWWHSPRAGLSVIRSPGLAALVRRVAAAMDNDCVTMPEGHLSRDHGFRTGVDDSMLRRRSRLIAKLDAVDADDIVAVVLEDRLLLSGQSHTIAVRGSFGQRQYDAAIAAARDRLTGESAWLHGPTVFDWAEHLAADRFEQLTADLLRADEQIIRVRSAGPTNQGDAGRDILATVVLAAKSPLAKGGEPVEAIPIVVQCKAHTRTVGKSDARDLRDTIEFHKASGLLLVVASQLSAPLVAHLERLGEDVRYVDWWSRTEIEERLRPHPELVARYPDILVPRE